MTYFKEECKISTVYFITSDKIGNQDPELGRRLMHSFFMQMLTASEKPAYMLFLEKGVKLLLPEFPTIDALKILQEEYNVKLLACATCLDFYGIREKIEVGEVSSMSEVIAVMHEHDKVIHL